MEIWNQQVLLPFIAALPSGLTFSSLLSSSIGLSSFKINTWFLYRSVTIDSINIWMSAGDCSPKSVNFSMKWRSWWQLVANSSPTRLRMRPSNVPALSFSWLLHQVMPDCKISLTYSKKSWISSNLAQDSRLAVSNSFIGQIRMLSPTSSMPARPARPTICLYWLSCRNSVPILGLLKITWNFKKFYVKKTCLATFLDFTLFAGRLTPAAKVDVQHRQHKAPARNPSSSKFLSFNVKPGKSISKSHTTYNNA